MKFAKLTGIAFLFSLLLAGGNAFSQTDPHSGRTVSSCFAGAAGNCFVNYTDGSFLDFYSTQCSALPNCASGGGSSGSDPHSGRTVTGCFDGAAGNCFVNYTDGSFLDFYNTQCSTLANCSAGGGSGSGSGSGSDPHNGLTVSSCFDGNTGNCFVNYTDGTFNDFYSTQCSTLPNCSGGGGSGSGSGNDPHNGLTVSSCFAGASNCFVNYTDGTFNDFYNTQCTAFADCAAPGGSGGTGSGGSGSGGMMGTSPMQPPLFYTYTAADCTVLVNPGDDYLPILSAAQPGDKICLREGDHVGGVYLSNINGAAGNHIVLMSYPGEKATIASAALSTHGINLFNNISYFDIFNLELKGQVTDTTTTPIPTSQGYPSGILGGHPDGSVHHIRVINNDIHDYGGGGVNFYFMSHADIQGNMIYNNARWSENMESGISVFKPSDSGLVQNNWLDGQGDGYSVLVRHNIVFNNENLADVPVTTNGVTEQRVSDGNCIVIDRFRETGYTGRAIVTQNICFNNGGHGLHVHESDNTVFRNNTSVYDGKTWWNAANNGNLTLWAPGAGLSNSNESRNTVFENNLTWAYPGPTNSWNLRVEAGLYPPSVQGQSRFDQTAAEMNTTLTNNIFVVTGVQSDPYLPQINGNVIWNGNPGLVMNADDSSVDRDYRVVPGSTLDLQNVGATFFMQ